MQYAQPRRPFPGTLDGDSMLWAQEDARLGAMQAFLEEALADLEQLEVEEHSLRVRLDELARRRAEAEMITSYLRKKLEEGQSQLRELAAPAAAGVPSPLEAPESTVAADFPVAPSPTSQSTTPMRTAEQHPKNRLRSATGQTRYEFARSMITSSDRGLTTTMLAQAFDNTDTPSRARVEGARQTLIKLIEDGVAERVSKNLYAAARNRTAAFQPTSEEAPAD